MNLRVLAIVALVALGGCVSAPIPRDPTAPLTVVTWNMEHLAEQNGTGCRPREDADYAALRTQADALDADVVAFQEVESAAAAARVFDPARYQIVMEDRVGTGRGGACRENPTLHIQAQRVGFAIRRDLRIDRRPDLTALQLQDPDLRSGVDVIVRPRAGRPLRLLAVHLKSGCAAGESAAACPVLLRQSPVLEEWMEDRLAEPDRFVVLGDFNRRLGLSQDRLWADWNDDDPRGATFVDAARGQGAACDPRYPDFIDHVVLDGRAAADLRGFREVRYAGAALSDHCPIAVTLAR